MIIGIKLPKLTKQDVNEMMANMVRKYGYDSKEVEYLNFRLKTDLLTTEEKLRTYFILYEFGFETFWNL